MQYVAVLGPRYSGKSMLVRGWTLGHDLEGDVSPSDPFVVLPVPRLQRCSVLDPKRHSETSSLGRSLARRMPVAVLLTLPRDVESAEAARKEMLHWANLARGHTDRIRMALVITKSDMTKPPLDDVPFGRVAYDVLSVTGAEEMFYTEAAKRGPDGVYSWLLDVLSDIEERQRQWESGRSALLKSRYTVCLDDNDQVTVRKPHAKDQQRTCDTCTLV